MKIIKITWCSCEWLYRWHHIFIPIVSHKDSFCHRGKSKLGIGLFIHELLREPLIEERGKPDYLEKNLSDQSREPTTNSTHMWPQVGKSNPGHIGGNSSEFLVPNLKSSVFSFTWKPEHSENLLSQSLTGSVRAKTSQIVCKKCHFNLRVVNLNTLNLVIFLNTPCQNF